MLLCACIVFFLALKLSSASESKLSDSKLLLPYFSSASVNYTIVGSGSSCYEWWSGTPEVVTVVPIGDFGKTCSERASVTAVWQSPFRRTSTIYARDFVTGHVLKCDVIVDDIHSIKVVTTTQELYLHNTPESLVVVGYDEFGNTFSSLDGIPFEWKIHPAIEKHSNISGDGVLRFLTWTESEYTTPLRIGLLEAEGMQGYMQLVSGLRTGSAVVSATLRESAYSHVPPAKVRLLVMANAQLNPPVLYLIPHSEAHFKISVVRQDVDDDIMMPSHQYYLSVEDESVVTLDNDNGSFITAEKHGQTTVTLLDRNIEEAVKMLGSNVSDSNDAETQMLAHHRRPMSIIYVVEPAYFRFSVKPVGEDSQICVAAARQTSFSKVSKQSHNPHWTLESGKRYNLLLDLYDQNNHRIFPSDNIRISVVFPDGISTVDSTENGTAHTIVPLKTGTYTVTSMLEGVMTKAGEMKLLGHPIIGSQEITIYSPLKIFPSQINLVWDVLGNASEGYALVAKGGSGDYVWTVVPTPQLPHFDIQKSGVTDAVVVSPEGVLFVKGVGSSVVVVSDLRNPGMCSHALVRVNYLANLEFSSGRVEIYLPKTPFLDNEVRLSSLKARSLSLDLRDLFPNPSNYKHPLNQLEKVDNAILSVGFKAQDVEGNAVTCCNNVAVQVRPKDSSIVQVLPGVSYIPPGAEEFDNDNVCGFVRVIGLHEGFTELEVFWASVENSEERKSRATFSVAVYKEIVFLPEIAVAAVTVGSSKPISYINGPSPWPLDGGSHFIELDFAESPAGKIVPSVLQSPQPFFLKENSSILGYNFVLRCESLGKFEVKLIVGNRPSATNPLPATLSAQFSLICDVPSKVELIPHLNLPSLPPGLPPCPLANHSLANFGDTIPISNNAPLVVEVIFKGLTGYELSGVDSIEVRAYITSDEGEANEIVSMTEPVVGFDPLSDSVVFSNPHFVVTPRVIGESAGLLHVQVTAKNQWREEKSDTLKSLLVLKMAPKVAIEPLEDFRLLVHSKAFARAHISHGSGFFHLDILSHESSSKLASQACLTIQPASYYERENGETQRDFLLNPKCKGKVTIRAVDLCFPSEPILPENFGLKPKLLVPAFAERSVSLVGLGALRLYAPLQLQLLSKAPVYIRAFDNEGHVLSAHFVNLLDLQVISSATHSSESNPPMVIHCPDTPPESDALGLPLKGVNGTHLWLSRRATYHGDLPGLARLSLCGQGLGPSKLKVTSGSIISNIETVNVYAPLSLKPCHLNLLLGAAHQITISGGPSSSSIIFQVTPERPGKPRLSVQRVGEDGDERGILLRGELGPVGSATILANATSSAGYAGLDTLDFEAWGITRPPSIFASMASCQVNVVSLSGIRIGCPLPTSVHGSVGRILVASADGNSSVGGVPVWAEGIATSSSGNGLLITPMGLADIQPPLHFSWRLSPPPPNSPIHIFHWLSHLNVEPDDTSLSSGIVLVGVAPGQVKLHLTVFTERGSLTGQLNSLDSHGFSQPVKKLSAEITFTVVPRLTLLNPPRQNLRILVSPNSRLQMTVSPHILTDGVTNYSLKCPNDSSVDMLRVTSGGLLESGVRGHCGTWSDWRLSGCLCHLHIDYLATFASGSDRSERGHQSLDLDVVVKPPLYALARAQSELVGLPNGNTGLPFGGPYTILLSFHDELGEAFDAVSENLLSIYIRAHRSCLFDYSVERVGSDSQSPLGRLMLRLTPPLHTEFGTLQYTTTVELTHDPLPGAEESVILPPIYLTIPLGSPLDVNGVSEFTVGQWACLPPLPQGDGVWSSSDPKLLWIDNQSKFMLPLRAGQVHLQFTPIARMTVQTSLLGKLTLRNVCSQSGSYPRPKSSASSVMPVGLDLTQEIHVHVELAPASLVANSSCASAVKISGLPENSPLTCSARLELGGVSGREQYQTQWVSLPNWLRNFLLAERYASTLSVVIESDLVASIPDNVLQSNDFHTHMIPSALREGSWDCVIRSGNPNDYYRLAIIPRGSLLVVEVKGSCGPSLDAVNHEVITRSELILVPAFRVLVPSMHLLNAEPLILNPRAPKANVIVFIPPATLAQMEPRDDPENALKARSQRPDVLSISSPPRPVYSVNCVKTALERMSSGHGHSSSIGGLFRNISLMMENEAQGSPEKALGGGLVWSVGVKLVPTKTATDTVVEVVLSLKVTGQHVRVPVRVQTRGFRTGEVPEGSDEDARTDYEVVDENWFNFSWIHLFLLVFFTIFLLLTPHMVALKLSGPGSEGTDPQNDLPPLSSFGGMASRTTPRLWSQGYGRPSSGVIASPTRTTSKTRTLVAPPASSPFGDTFSSYIGETPGAATRSRGAPSPSRLREAFDISL